MTNKFYNPITTNSEAVNAEIIEFTQNIINCHNERAAYRNPNFNPFDFSLTGNFEAKVKTELYPHPTNPALMNTGKFLEYSAEFETVTKRFKNGKVKSYKTYYHVKTVLIEVLEVGGYYDQR